MQTNARCPTRPAPPSGSAGAGFPTAATHGWARRSPLPPPPRPAGRAGSEPPARPVVWPPSVGGIPVQHRVQPPLPGASSRARGAAHTQSEVDSPSPCPTGEDGAADPLFSRSFPGAEEPAHGQPSAGRVPPPGRGLTPLCRCRQVVSEPGPLPAGAVQTPGSDVSESEQIPAGGCGCPGQCGLLGPSRSLGPHPGWGPEGRVGLHPQSLARRVSGGRRDGQAPGSPVLGSAWAWLPRRPGCLELMPVEPPDSGQE